MVKRLIKEEFKMNKLTQIAESCYKKLRKTYDKSTSYFNIHRSLDGECKMNLPQDSGKIITKEFLEDNPWYKKFGVKVGDPKPYTPKKDKVIYYRSHKDYEQLNQ